ncbi:MAG: glycosyltransferase family 4 protein [Patescibacteria group bacterium]|nr:glycosyltransferase family 4 protein [Patescibacteria group bacterium]MBU2460621.1 glycosyltransferase family 4 protein [Patescibacteria group bacterium]
MVPRVLMFGWEFPPHSSGGLGTACLGLTRALANEEVEVIFVLPKKINLNANHVKFIFAENGENKLKVQFRAIDSVLQPYLTSNGYIKELDQVTKKTIYGVTLIDEVKRYARQARIIAMNEEFDVIHAHDWLSFYAGVEAKKISGKPLILHFHATEFDRSGGQGANSEVFALEQEAIKYADSIIAVSNFTKNLLVEKYYISPERIEVVHNAIEEPDEMNLPATLEEIKATGTKIVLYLGRITIQKGPDYFIQTAKRVLDIYDGKVLFVVVGSGDMHKQMIDQVAALGISDKVIFTGMLLGEAVTKMFRAADLFVMPSVSEPFGLVPLEAALQNTPSIISKQSGISEVTSHMLKVDFWDIDEMANQIISVLTYGSLQQTLTENAKKEAKKLTWNTPAKKCVALYNKIINKSK